MTPALELLDNVTATLSRRSFVGWMVSSVPLFGAIRIDVLQPTQREGLDDALLLALATAILPTAYGGDGHRRAATDLQNWVKGFVPAAERNHPYGSARIGNTGADPSPRWTLQLRTLDMDARTFYNRAFAALTADERRAIVRRQLNQERSNSITGDVASASHVALALLASFYSSSDATDLCYEVRIGKATCRPLTTSSQRPLPLAGQRE